MDFPVSWCNTRPSLEQTQQLQKQHHDAKTNPAPFHIGDDVFILDNNPYLHKSQKLTNKYKGPFKCIKIDGSHLFLVLQDKLDATPLRWHMEFAKLACTTPEPTTA